MIFVNTLSPEARQELAQLTQQAVGRVAQRAWMVLWSAEAVPVPEIARRFHCQPKTARRWLRRYQRTGAALDLRLCLRLLVGRHTGAASGHPLLAARQPLVSAAGAAQTG
jgi:hypothetical protein